MITLSIFSSSQFCKFQFSAWILPNVINFTGYCIPFDGMALIPFPTSDCLAPTNQPKATWKLETCYLRFTFLYYSLFYICRYLSLDSSSQQQRGGWLSQHKFWSTSFRPHRRPTDSLGMPVRKKVLLPFARRKQSLFVSPSSPSPSTMRLHDDYPIRRVTDLSRNSDRTKPRVYPSWRVSSSR